MSTPNAYHIANAAEAAVAELREAVDAARRPRPDPRQSDAIEQAAQRIAASVAPIADRYNGWTNYETWAVNLWLANEERTYLRGRGIGLVRDDRDAEAQLLDMVEEIVFGDEAPANVGTDLIRHALGRVDWAEILAAFREE